MLGVVQKQNNEDLYINLLTSAKRAGCPADQMRRFRAVGYVPQPKQLQFHAAARQCDSPDGPTRIGYGGSRGPGKSHAVLAQVGADDCQRFDGAKWLLLRKVGVAAKEGFEDLLMRAWPPWVRYYVPSRGQIVFPNGSRIIIGHFQNEKDVDKYLGLEYDGIAIEEATQLSRAKLEMIATVCRTSKPNWRPRMYYTWNPGGVGHAYIKQLFVMPWRKGQEESTRFIPGTVRDNRHVNPEYRATLEGLTGWRRAAWLDGDMDIAAGQFFTNWRHDIHVRSSDFVIPPGARVWCSLDYGFTHYTAVYLLCLHDGMVTVVDEHCERRWLPPRHAAAIRAMLARHGLKLSDLWRFVASPDAFHVGKDRGGLTIADQYADEGIVLESAKNDSRIGRASQWLQRLGDYEAETPIPHGIEVCDRCARLIECIPAMEHDPHQPEAVLKVDPDDNGDGGDDPFDSSGYGLLAAPVNSWLLA